MFIVVLVGLCVVRNMKLGNAELKEGSKTSQTFALPI